MKKLSDEVALLFKLLKDAQVRNRDTGCYAVKASLDGRYPYVYPRDVASLVSTLDLLGRNGIKEGRCADRMATYADFIAHCQRKDGYVGQRYDSRFQDKSIYRQEDNQAHFIHILAAPMLLSGHMDRDHINAIRKAIKFALSNYYRDEINLFLSTTSVHESGICGGYDIWTNFAYHRAIQDILSLEKTFHVSILSRQMKELLSGAKAEHVFFFEDRYLRRLSRDGETDLALDFVCISPFYFGIDTSSERLLKTAKYLREGLWDPLLGGLLRYQAYTEELETHLHAGSGPWMQYTAVLAQVFYHNGLAKEGDEILAIVDKYRDANGYIPEHVSTKGRFEEFMRLEWETGLDFQKEFNRAVLCSDIKFDLIVEELENMKSTYYAIKERLAKNPHLNYITFGSPLLWSHSEYCKALFYREKAKNVAK